MRSCVLDASALIAFLFQESGSDFVAARLPGSLISAVNLSEVAARAIERGMTLEVFDREIGRLPVAVAPFDAALGNVTAALKAPTRPAGLSFADRACLALALDRRLPAVTSDSDWGRAGLDVELVFFR